MSAVGRLRNGDECGADAGVWCEVEGEVGVFQIFDNRVVLLVNQVEIGVIDSVPSALSVLGIGTARAQAHVMRKVKTFAPELAFLCGVHS